MVVCRVCGCRFDELCFYKEIDGTDENGDLVVNYVEHCPECGSEELDYEDDPDDFCEDIPEYHDEAMEKYRLNHSEMDELEQEERDYEGDDEDD